MKTTHFLNLGILVVLCFGSLWAIQGPGNNDPVPQDQQAMTNAINNANHQIDLGEAIRLIRNRTSNLKSSSSATSDKKGGFFARSAFEIILAQPGVVGIRYYYAQKDDGTPTVVLVGVDAKGEDVLTGALMERSLDCPPWCQKSSVLGN